MTLGRTLELEYLNSSYARAGSQIMVVYGAKNVGKTTLLKQFMKGKPCAYYLARSSSEREQRYQWGKELGMDSVKYPSYAEILQHLIRKSTEKTVIFIDEFQHIIRSGDELMKALVYLVHNNESGTPVMVVLGSSSTGWVENSMVTQMGEAAYGLSGLLKIRELGFEVMREYFQGFSIEEAVEAYAVLGGIPGLWKYFNDKVSIKENICRYILNKDAFLFGEGSRIAGEELRETGVYNTILAAIAAGHHKLNDLFLHTGFSRAKISVYLKNLMELELVEKVFSYDTEGKANTQKGVYQISNHFVDFYFTYLYPNLSSLEVMLPEEFYHKYIAPSFHGYVSEYFKLVCRQYIEKQSEEGKLPIEVDRIGRWVGKFGDIDIIAQNKEKETLVALCSKESSGMRYDDYEWLLFCVEKARLQADYVYLFSAHGFDERICQEAKVKKSLKLISMDEM